ncbi:MAG: hypothetical protein WCJ14_11250 [Verrucomicrobiota bacterium]
MTDNFQSSWNAPTLDGVVWMAAVACLSSLSCLADHAGFQRLWPLGTLDPAHVPLHADDGALDFWWLHPL